MLIQSVYTSAAIQPMPKSKLYKILVDSRVNNKLADVTGLLVYVDGRFLQVLEGEQEVISALLEKISKGTFSFESKVILSNDGNLGSPLLFINLVIIGFAGEST